MKPGKNRLPPLLGKNFQNSGWNPPPLTLPPLITKQLDQMAPILPTKGWNARSLAFLGWVGSPEANTEIRLPLIYDCLQNSSDCFPACKAAGNSTSQLAMHIDPF
jgi:hypothetical protein